MLGYKFRLYPSKTIETYLNTLIFAGGSTTAHSKNKAKTEGRELTPCDTQKLIVWGES
ncbi:MAG: hypothetical protein QMC86_03970 [Methanothermobacter sp.]|nr:hypothetical protein [Methanothermobacter sp.]